ncbi:MAG: DUF413 domain-containing protein [Kangiellaceae bacterium]|nr:DUF413 domain-containing protein [Kangiellaceae bacterium]
MESKRLNSRTYWSNRRFADPKKFPYGFSRSGEFSVAQSELLERKGALWTALLSGWVLDPTKEDCEFIEAIEQRDYLFNQETLVWSKYQNYSRQIYTIGERPKQVATIHKIEVQEIVEDSNTISSELSDKWLLDEDANTDEFLQAS